MSPVDAMPHEPPPPIVPGPEDQNLALLSILFYVYAGFVVFTALLFGIFAAMGLVLIPGLDGKPGTPPEVVLVTTLFLVVFGLMALLFVAQAVVMVLAGRALGRRSGYVISMIAACLALMNIPLGTALGIFAIITLLKPGVRERLGR